MPISKSTLKVLSLLIVVCASPAMIHCAKPAQLGSDTMHAMGMKGMFNVTWRPAGHGLKKSILRVFRLLCSLRMARKSPTQVQRSCRPI